MPRQQLHLVAGGLDVRAQVEVVVVVVTDGEVARQGALLRKDFVVQHVVIIAFGFVV